MGSNTILPELLDQIPDGDEIGTVSADRAYDTRRCHMAIIDRQATAIIPIRKNGRAWKEDARLQSQETKPCVPPGTMAGHSGSDGPDTTPAAGSKRRCGASKL